MGGCLRRARGPFNTPHCLGQLWRLDGREPGARTWGTWEDLRSVCRRRPRLRLHVTEIGDREKPRHLAWAKGTNPTPQGCALIPPHLLTCSRWGQGSTGEWWDTDIASVQTAVPLEPPEPPSGVCSRETDLPGEGHQKDMTSSGPVT